MMARTVYRWKHGAPRTVFITGASSGMGRMKAFAGSRTLDASMPVLLRGIARRQFEIVDGPRPALTAFLSRRVPRLARWTGDRITARTLQKIQKAQP